MPGAETTIEDKTDLNSAFFSEFRIQRKQCVSDH